MISRSGPTAAARLEALLASPQLVVGFLDAELRYTHVNERLAALNARPVAEHLGRPVVDVLPHLAFEIEPLMRGVLETGEPVVGVERTHPDVAGRPHHVLASYLPVRGDDGSVEGV